MWLQLIECYSNVICKTSFYTDYIFFLSLSVISNCFFMFVISWICVALPLLKSNKNCKLQKSKVGQKYTNMQPKIANAKILTIGVQPHSSIVYLLLQLHNDKLFFCLGHPLQLPPQPLHLLLQKAAILSALPGQSGVIGAKTKKKQRRKLTSKLWGFVSDVGMAYFYIHAWFLKSDLDVVRSQVPWLHTHTKIILNEQVNAGIWGTF